MCSRNDVTYFRAPVLRFPLNVIRLVGPRDGHEIDTTDKLFATIGWEGARPTAQILQVKMEEIYYERLGYERSDCESRKYHHIIEDHRRKKIKTYPLRCK